MIRFDRAACRNLDVALRREWLQTNGLGGYASSTIIGLNTRRYHGLLMAATKPHVGRMLLLSKLEETLVVDGRRYDLSANRYPGVVHPHGHLLLKEFRQDAFPVFVYEIEGLEFEKSVFMAPGENTSIIRYELRTPVRAIPATCTLELRPLIAFRDYHATTHENAALNPHFDVAADSVKLTPYSGLPSLYLNHSGADIQPSGCWFRNFEYDRERERGLDFHEDLFNPLVLVFDLRRDRSVSIAASTAARPARAEIPAPSGIPLLVRAAGQFIVQRGSQSSVIAGYHWFGDWGRDTMIALPGLTLATGRPEIAKSILLAFAAHVDRGMLPNRFPDAGEAPEYNTVDATLWFFEAVRALLEHTHDYDFVRTHLYDVLSEIVAWHARGTRYGIYLDHDGLLHAGEAGVQLTWMDAKIGDWVVTPRTGKPVEIQALWHNALRVMEDLAQRYGHADDSAYYRGLADRARASFVELFWNAAAECLYDVLDGDARDSSLRPNQIFAVSLFHKMLPPDKAKAVVDAIEKHLLTPYGLRTLAPGDPRYRGRYEGDPASRDGTYHQGTVWPWLLGPFVSAYSHVYGRAPQCLDELQRYAAQEGLGQIPEVFDGDAPHRPGGCIAQAWSVAELLRVSVEGGL
ncbi:MAG TPA: amylo-alpha-1,6-glucosidase [Bryobacteraceae bacterium]|jgi:glycogen debranching enzyme|nr:amylo-alpha-1,6-glucosidase [Bryobacteraceae bacterium]